MVNDVSGYRSVLVLVLLWLATVAVPAQPNVEIYWDPTDRLDTIMDFGVTLEGAPVTLTFTVVNNDAADVGVLLPNAQADPYYQIVNTPEYPPEHPRKEEFIQRESLPYLIEAGTQRRFGVIYRALAGDPRYPPDSVAEALLQLRVVRVLDSLGPSVDKTFLLRALKTTKFLASNTPWLPFDSVYVQPQPLAPERSYRVENVTSFRIPVTAQKLDMQTSVIGDPEFEIDTFEMAEFGSKGSLTWTPRYRPRNTGRDSAHFIVEYRPNENAVPDTVLTRLSGIGVVQLLRVVNAQGDPQEVTVRGDTIDFGFVDVGDQGGVTATIVVRNEGNLNIFLTGEKEHGIPRDTQAYVVERPLRSGGQTIRTNETDTLIVRFDPIDGGTHRMRYEISTDLLTRSIDGVPDGEQTIDLFCTGFARKPQIQVSPPSLNFGTVVLLEDCNSASVRRLTIRNVGNSLLRVDSIVIDPQGAPLLIDDDAFTVEPAEEHDVIIRFEPQSVIDLAAKLVLYTNAFGVPYEVTAVGRSVAPDTITVSVPPITRARPGTPIAVPVVVDADRVALTETSTTVISFDPTLLRYRGVRTEQTAAEGAAIIRQTESPRGVLTIELEGNGSFIARDTFMVVTFDTYLGDQPLTEIALSPSTTMFGNAGCASVLDVTVSSGAYQIDSLCGLDYLTTTVNGFTIDAGVFPNPASGEARVTIAAPSSQQVSIRVVDAFGRPLTDAVVTTVPEGMSLIPVRLDDVAPGACFLEVRGEHSRRILSLMVQR